MLGGPGEYNIDRNWGCNTVLRHETGHQGVPVWEAWLSSSAPDLVSCSPTSMEAKSKLVSISCGNRFLACGFLPL